MDHNKFTGTYVACHTATYIKSYTLTHIRGPADLGGLGTYKPHKKHFVIHVASALPTKDVLPL